MKRTHTCLVILLLSAGLPLASGAQVLKNLVNNMRNNTRPTISPQDSAAAIKSFMTGTGGSGWLIQYKVTYNFSIKNKTSVSTDTTSMALTESHNVRTDMGIPGEKTILLGHANMPRYSIFIHPDSKTYTFNIIDTAAINSPRNMTYQVTKVGNETVQGYSCIHARLVTMSSGRPTVTEDIWTSKDVPGYALMKQLSTAQNATPAMLRALQQAGCDGMFVKMTSQASTYSMEMLLIAATRKTFPDAMFQLPAGYTQQTHAGPFAH